MIGKLLSFGDLQPLPRNEKPIRSWSNRDDAFTDVALAIREVIEDLNGISRTPISEPVPINRKRSSARSESGERKMPNIPATPTLSTTIGTSALKPAINRYYKGLKEFEGKADYELALRSAFQNLLADTARIVSWTLIPEQTIEGNIRPDGVLRDKFNLKRGFWEAKGPKSDLEKEIQKKIADGYPLVNTVFENTKRAVLYQNKRRASEYDLQNFNDVSYLLRDFFAYTEPDIATFRICCARVQGKYSRTCWRVACHYRKGT